MKTLHIEGKRWFQKTYGNTYHSVYVYVDGEFLEAVKFAYGYDRHYLQTAEKILDRHGLLPDMERYQHGGTESLWRYCERKGIKFVDRVTDVERKKDL